MPPAGDNDMPPSSKDVIAQLEANGWIKVRQVGSHIHFKHPDKPQLVTVNHPMKDMRIGTLKSIGRKSGLRFRK